ncbi:hypothetical protein LSAT2_010184 [Lamellibrachia satsuma]|nr:hypothetical protein LSAT2_010184 [Lamellibrachia satsuma]
MHTSRDERRRWRFLYCCIHRNSSSTFRMIAILTTPAVPDPIESDAKNTLTSKKLGDVDLVTHTHRQQQVLVSSFGFGRLTGQ